MELNRGDIIQALQDVNCKFTYPGGYIKDIIIKKDSIYKVSGIDESINEIYLVEDNGPGAEISFNDVNSFIKIN
jgi:hypothetical protein